MKRALSLLLLTTLTIAVPPRASAQSAKPPPCIRYASEPRYSGLGYNHLVHITNACDAAEDCVVTTDVNPEPQRVEVPGHQEVIVSTFMGSPSRVFTPHVTCEARK